MINEHTLQYFENLYNLHILILVINFFNTVQFILEQIMKDPILGYKEFANNSEFRIKAASVLSYLWFVFYLGKISNQAE